MTKRIGLKPTIPTVKTRHNFGRLSSLAPSLFKPTFNDTEHKTLPPTGVVNLRCICQSTLLLNTFILIKTYFNIVDLIMQAKNSCNEIS